MTLFYCWDCHHHLQGAELSSHEGHQVEDVTPKGEPPLDLRTRSASVLVE